MPLTERILFAVRDALGNNGNNDKSQTFLRLAFIVLGGCMPSIYQL